MALLITATAAPRQRRGARERLGQLRFLLALGMTIVAAMPAGLRAQPANPKEYQIKAVFLFNFIQFVEWPAAAFPQPDSPIRIGVLGDDPFAGALETAVRGERVRQHPLVIERAQHLQDLHDCHLVFICRSEQARIGAIISFFTGRPVLTVGDMPGFAQRGGIINFFLEGQKVRFEINRAVAQRSGLKLSSQLLGLARLIGPTTQAVIP